MALTIEDGSGVAGANSYISAEDARAYAEARGLVLPEAGDDSEDDPVEILLMNALDYIESFRAEFQGMKTTQAQPLQWPRDGVILDGYELGYDEIPEELPAAQAQLAVDAYSRPLMSTGAGREKIRERVEGAVEVEYAPSGNSNPQPTFTAARALLAPLLRRGGGFGLSTVRV
jgi:hypothetical protein